MERQEAGKIKMIKQFTNNQLIVISLELALMAVISLLHAEEVDCVINLLLLF